MDSERVVLCGASAYEEKFYLNDRFQALPQSIQDELKVLCVLYTQDVGGVLTLEYDEEGAPVSYTHLTLPTILRV